MVEVEQLTGGTCDQTTEQLVMTTLNQHWKGKIK